MFNKTYFPFSSFQDQLKAFELFQTLMDWSSSKEDSHQWKGKESNRRGNRHSKPYRGHGRGSGRGGIHSSSRQGNQQPGTNMGELQAELEALKEKYETCRLENERLKGENRVLREVLGMSSGTRSETPLRLPHGLAPPAASAPPTASGSSTVEVEEATSKDEDATLGQIGKFKTKGPRLLDAHFHLDKMFRFRKGHHTTAVSQMVEQRVFPLPLVPWPIQGGSWSSVILEHFHPCQI